MRLNFNSNSKNDLLSTYYVVGSMFGAEDIKKKSPCLQEAYMIMDRGSYHIYYNPHRL